MPPMSLLIKPASGRCNLRCSYCFYADEMSTRQTPSYGQMTLDTLESLVKKGLAAADYSITFAFQGGEPTLSGLDFYKKFCQWKNLYNIKGLQVNCCIQTNGLLIDEEWASFLAREHFLIGLSLDGPRTIHDACRLDSLGEGSFKRVMHTAGLLAEAKAEFNILTVLTETAAHSIERIYKFLMGKGFSYQQYIPCLNPLDGIAKDYSLTPQTYGTALKKLFDLWYADKITGIHTYNRYFENLVGILAGYEPESCDMRGHCSVQYVVEADGGVYPCDFYVLDEYRLGNISVNSFTDIDEKRRELLFLEPSFVTAPECRTCQWLNLCRGGCRRNREPFHGGAPGSNRFCSAYQEFLSYAHPRLQYLADTISCYNV